jgi:hypothetical protein
MINNEVPLHNKWRVWLDQLWSHPLQRDERWWIRLKTTLCARSSLIAQRASRRVGHRWITVSRIIHYAYVGNPSYPPKVYIRARLGLWVQVLFLKTWVFSSNVNALVPPFYNIRRFFSLTTNYTHLTYVYETKIISKVVLNWITIISILFYIKHL